MKQNDPKQCKVLNDMIPPVKKRKREDDVVKPESVERTQPYHRDLPKKKKRKIKELKRRFKREIQDIRFRDVKTVWSACNDRTTKEINWEEMIPKHCKAFWKPQSLRIAVWRYFEIPTIYFLDA